MLLMYHRDKLFKSKQYLAEQTKVVMKWFSQAALTAQPGAKTWPDTEADRGSSALNSFSPTSDLWGRNLLEDLWRDSVVNNRFTYLAFKCFNTLQRA